MIRIEVLGPGCINCLRLERETERAVAAIVAQGPTTVDGIVAATGLSVAAVLGTLSLLEARGLVGSGYGRYVPIGRLASAPAR